MAFRTAEEADAEEDGVAPGLMPPPAALKGVLIGDEDIMGARVSGGWLLPATCDLRRDNRHDRSSAG